MLAWLTEASDYMPHGMCLLWRPNLMALHIVSDAVIAGAYFAIPAAIAVFVSRRKDLTDQHRAVAILFTVFITACGLTHVMSIVVLWRPYYAAEGILKMVTALASIGTALFLPLLIPQLLRIPSPRTLAAEIDAHKRTLVELEVARTALAQRVERTESDLLETTRRFEAALQDSPIAVFEQDEDLVFTWVYNPAVGVGSLDLVGQAEAETHTFETADRVRALKKEALASGTPRRADVQVVTEEANRWFDLRVEPITLADGRPGLIATSTDITRLKENEERLQVLMAELNHRSKNLLTIGLSIVRQTARGFQIPAAFAEQLHDRLGSLASAHDVLARQDWTGADLAAVLRSQLHHQITTYGERLTFEGPECLLPPEATHYVGMALHELGSNAMKYGALSGEHGQVRIRWDVDPSGPEEDLHLTWTETGGPEISEPPRSQGFGSAILRKLTPAALSGSASLTFLPSGLVWELRGRLARRSPPAAISAAPAG